jgi:small-conductance mechanosensitive channel
LISAAVRVLLILFALVLIVGPWEASTAGLFESIQSLPLGFRVGEVYISFRSILASAAVLVIALVLTRIVQRWLQSQFLPRTAIEPSLQLSIGTIFGYVGVIAAISLALGGLGIDLQKIAIVAGALSVGIGFGLQSIVSNFVSGLILLAERPIRVGDQVVVKGESGWVRRVRVRATEIETFDRATVIIPNSEFITGVVMNWTHANTMGRFIVKVGVGYESDPAQVRDVLLAIAADHPKVLKTPGPWAQLTNLGESALDFEMGCMVADVGDRGAVKSDLHFEILKRFREKGIEIPYPQREVRMRAAEAPATGDPLRDRTGSAPERPQS